MSAAIPPYVPPTPQYTPPPEHIPPPGPGQQQAAPEPGMQLVKGRWVKQNWEGQMNDLNEHVMPQVFERLSARDCDCTRQMVGALFCGIFCLPCAFTRLFGHCTGCFDPMRVSICGTERRIVGLELCSANDCSQLCGSDERGYGHSDYNKAQDQGSGFSRKKLDVMNIVGVATLVTGCATGVIQ